MGPSTVIHEKHAVYSQCATLTYKPEDSGPVPTGIQRLQRFQERFLNHTLIQLPKLNLLRVGTHSTIGIFQALFKMLGDRIDSY